MNKLHIPLLALAAISTLRAEGSLPWADLPAALRAARAMDKDSEFVVVTKAGGKHKGPGLTFLNGELWAPDAGYIPRGTIATISVRHRGPLSHFNVLSGRLACNSDELFGCAFDPKAWLLLPVDLAIGLAATPTMMPVEGLRRLAPAKILYRAAP